MPRRLSRLVGALTALWSLALNGGPVALHDCPMHSLPAAVGSAATPMGHDMSHDMGAMQHDASSSSEQAPGEPQSHKNCCCPDGGCTSTPVALVAAAVSLPNDLSTVDAAPASARVAVDRAPRLDLALPYSNGPPLL